MSFGRPIKPPAPLDEPALHEYALKSLGRRPRTETELRRLLRAKVEADEAGAARIAAVLARLKEYGLLNDAAFAENYVQLRQRNEKHGSRRVTQDLGQKGVPQQIIRETVETGYAEISEEALAREHLDRKRIRKPGTDKEVARVMRQLIRAGFSTGTIYKILRQWEVPDETLAGLDTVEVDELAGE